MDTIVNDLKYSMHLNSNANKMDDLQLTIQNIGTDTARIAKDLLKTNNTIAYFENRNYFKMISCGDFTYIKLAPNEVFELKTKCYQAVDRRLFPDNGNTFILRNPEKWFGAEIFYLSWNVNNQYFGPIEYHYKKDIEKGIQLGILTEGKYPHLFKK
jgi:hypothetical protein